MGFVPTITAPNASLPLVEKPDLLKHLPWVVTDLDDVMFDRRMTRAA